MKKTTIAFLAAAFIFASCNDGFKPFTFVQMTDTQIGFMDGSDGYAHSDSLLRAAVEGVNALQPAFVVVTGDLVDDVDDSKQNEIFEAGMAALEEPYYLIPGNHDYRKAWTPEIRDAYVASRGYERFSFKLNGCAFIGLDTNCIKEDATEAEDEQMAWLKGELSKAGKSRYIFVFIHCPIFRNDIDEVEDYSNFPKPKRLEYLSLFKETGVDAVFAGHTHEDYDTEYEGIRLVVANPVCNPLGHGHPGYNVIRVTKDGFTVETVSTVD